MVYAKAAALRRFGTFNAQLLAEHLASHGYKVAIRSALGGGPGTSCFRHLRNEFLVVLPDKRSMPCCPDGSIHSLACLQGCEELLIVEPNFREHFAINDATVVYDELVRGVPVEFVGPASRLQPLVTMLAAEMHEAFLSRGMERPPWRKPSALLSKWVPEKSKSRDREPISAHTSRAGSPTAAALEAGPPRALQPPVFAQQPPRVRPELSAAQDYLEALALTANHLQPLTSNPGFTYSTRVGPARSLLSSSLRRQSEDVIAMAALTGNRPSMRRSCDVNSVMHMAERMQGNLMT